MKRGILLTFLFCLLWTVVGRAASVAVMINVDKPNNVTVQTLAGHGNTIDLTEGMNRVEFDTDTDNPLTITANDGAQIVSVTLNQSEQLTPSGDGVYRIGITGPSMIDIVTSGDAGGSAQMVNLTFNVDGTNVTGKPYSLAYEGESGWVDLDTGSWMVQIPQNAKVKITPHSPYKIDGCDTPGYTGPFDGKLQEDGTYTFTNTLPDYFGVTIHMSLLDTAILFSITVDYSKNVNCYLENGRVGDPELLTVYDNVKTNFAIEASKNPLEFVATSGAEVTQVLKNGVAQNKVGTGNGSWLFEVENGDEFVVTTKGAPTDILVQAPDGNAELQYYYFTRADGTQIDLSGRSATVTGNLGEKIGVAVRPGTTMTYIMAGNGGVSDWYNYMQVVSGADGTNPAKYQIFGTRSVNGVVINVDAAARVKVLQEGGRGDALQLTDGKNEFAIADIKNSLVFSSTEGNQLVSVSVNGNPVNVSTNGYYMVEAKEGDWIDVVSRKNPVDVTLSFAFNEGMDINSIKAVSDGNVVELSNPMTVRTYTTLTFTAAAGYVLDDMMSATAGVTVEKSQDGTKYNVTVTSADVTSAMLSVIVSEMQASEGHSIVIPNGEEIMVSFWEMDDMDGDLSETFVKALTNNTVNEVYTGDWIRIYCRDSQSEFAYIKVNGEPIELVKNSEGLARVGWVEVHGRTVIDTKVVTPCQVMTNPSYDDVKHIQSGNVYIEVDGELLTNTTASAGETIKLVAQAATGYVFDHFEKFYSETTEGIVLEGDTYTITEADAAQNFILFKGVFTADPDQPVYALRGSSAWILDEENKPLTAVGNVVFQLNDGSYSRETTALAGETVELFVSVANEEDQDKYEVAYYSLMNGFPNSVIPVHYVVNAEDADAEGVIWICAVVREKGSGVTEIAGNGLWYDNANMTIHCSKAVKVFDINGKLVKESEATQTSVSDLEHGVYIAVDGSETIKFVK